MGFNAAQAVSALEYDFSTVGGPRGCTPEPTADQVRAMQARMRTYFKLDDPDPAALTEYVRSLSQEELDLRLDELIEIWASVLSGQPSAEEIRALPHRVQQAYIGWLSGEINTPTAGSSVTKRSLAPLKSVGSST